MKRLSKEERRRQIAEAALRIIAEQGLRKFTVSAISDEVGLADGTIFRHFEDKDDIVLEAVRRLEQMLLEKAVPMDGDGDPLEQIGRFLRHRVELIRQRPEVFKVLFSDDLAKAGPEEAAARVRRLKHGSMSFLLSLLHQAKDQGLLADGANPDELLYVVHGTALALVFSGADLDQVTGPDIDPAEVWQTLEALMRKDES